MLQAAGWLNFTKREDRNNSKQTEVRWKRRMESRLTNTLIDVSWHLTFTRVKNTNRTKQLLTRVRCSIDLFDLRFALPPLQNSPLYTIHAIFFQPRTERSRIFVGDKFFEGTSRHE